MERNKPVINQAQTFAWVLGKDSNPLANIFAKSSAGNAAYFGSSFVAVAGGMALLHRHGHHRLERILPMAVSVMETYCVIHNHQNIRTYDHFASH
jgi:hypothetical protein